jgi:hypothetical protein
MGKTITKTGKNSLKTWHNSTFGMTAEIPEGTLKEIVLLAAIQSKTFCILTFSLKI